MTDITHRTVETNGIHLHIAEAGEGPLVLLLHGWPESWYSWRHQLRALAAAGYHAVAPDVRGYGRSDKPREVAAYSMKHLLADFTGLLDALGEQTAVVVGHDWGASMAWTSAALHPDRYRAVVGLSVPYLGRPPMPPTRLFRQMLGEQWFYVLYFQEPGVAEAELEADVPRTLRTLLGGVAGFDMTAEAVRARKPGDGFLTGLDTPRTLPEWLTEEDLAYLVKELQGSGFRGGLNRYRNMDRDWEELSELATARIEQPALFIIGEKDPGRAMAPVELMKPLAPGLEDVRVIPGAGHWLQQERAAEVNAALLAFLAKLPRGKTSDDALRAVTVGELKPLTRPITVSDYDPRWPEVFEQEATRIRAALGSRVKRLEHVGSTSVPGLPAKPVIDLVLTVADSADEPGYVPMLEAAGYVLRIREPQWFEHRLFKGPGADLNLHVFTEGCPEVDQMLLFRDWLRAHPEDRELYAATKRELATREWKYVQNYADAKTDVVRRILAKARG